MSADFRESVRLERREHTRASDQARIPLPRATVAYAACRCVDRDHDDHDRMDWVGDVEAAYEDGVAMQVAGFHIIRVEEVAI